MIPKFFISATFIGFPIVDLAFGILTYYGVHSFSISMLYRVVYLTMVLLYVLRFKFTPSVWLTVNLLAIYFLFSILHWLFSYGVSAAINGIEFLFKTQFFMAVYLVSKELLKNFEEKKVVEFISIYALIAGLAFLFSFFFRIGYLTYGDYAFGIKSFYYSGNDIGITVFISMSVAFYGWVKYSSRSCLVSFSLGVFSLVVLGTKAGWLFLFLIVIMLFWSEFVCCSRSWSLRVVQVVFLGFLVAFLIWYLLPLIKNVVDLLSFQVGAVEKIMNMEGPRDFLIAFGAERISEFSKLDIIFGIGGEFFRSVGIDFYSEYERDYGVSVNRAVESDVYDLIGMFGFFGFALIAAPYLYFLFRSFLHFLRARDFSYFILFFIFALTCLHSIVAGHVMYSPQVGVLLGGVAGLIGCGCARSQEKYKEKSVAYN